MKSFLHIIFLLVKDCLSLQTVTNSPLEISMKSQC